MSKTMLVVLGVFATGDALAAGPYPSMAGISAAADSASAAVYRSA